MALDVCEQQDTALDNLQAEGKRNDKKCILCLMIMEIILQIHTGSADGTFFIF